MSLLNKSKHWLYSLFRYPPYWPADKTYDEYWRHRDMNAPLNSFQEERAQFLAKHLSPGDSVLDVGCGDGRMLDYLKKKFGHSCSFTGLDSSGDAAARARKRGIEVIEGNIEDEQERSEVGMYDFVTLFEVIEHTHQSEVLLEWARGRARKGVFFSVPNTGFITHRLRLLFGRFPLQWRAHPSEHVRFWTLRDMHWWLRQLGYRYELHTYEGIPVLNRIWPALFAAGQIVVLKK